MNRLIPKSKLTFLFIWFGIFLGLFVKLYLLGGRPFFTKELYPPKFPLILVGFLPIAIGMTSRVILLPKAKNDQSFMTIFIISLALCESFAIASFFLFKSDNDVEKYFTFIGSVLGVATLFPLGIGNNDGTLS